ncbi:MAG: Crp/Fnr family transcriptional regulator [Bacteroidota bacterium]|nr:Crp/Fnr family transcriptional regulator [Bacteroidota bacterium]
MNHKNQFYIKCQDCPVWSKSVFGELSEAELEQLNKVKTSYVFSKDRELFREGQTSQGVFCLGAGVCKISKSNAEGKSHIIKLIKPASLLAERALINQETLNLTATTLDEVKACFVPKDFFLNLLKTNVKFSFNLLKEVCKNLKEVDNDLVDMAQKNAKKRMAHTLLYLNQNFNSSGVDKLDIQLSREDLANITGTTKESCIRILNEFFNQKLIKLEGKDIHILNPTALQKLYEN